MTHDPTSLNQNPPQDGAAAGLLTDVVITHDHLLGGNVMIAQPKSGFRVGTDAVFLAASVGVCGTKHAVMGNSSNK